MEFSRKQRDIIECRGSNILVSAAAGSGKTAVLVQRIIERVMDDNDRLNIDEILVLTFTKAAAAEMRERIGRALNDELERNPENEHLKKQAALIYNAQITTIDSFCLNILKNNFTEIGLEPGFRLAKEAEMTFLIDEVLEDSIEEALGKREINYLDELLGRFHSKDNLDKFKEIVLELLDQAERAPFVEDFFEVRKRDYDVNSFEELRTQEWFIDLEKEITSDIKNAVEMTFALEKACQDNNVNEYLKVIKSDRELLEKLSELDFPQLSDAFEQGISWSRMPSKVSCDAEFKEYMKDNRSLYKDLINGISKNYFGQKIDTILPRMQESSRVIKALMEFGQYFYNRLEEVKRSRGLITFSDMEHLALKILLKKEGDSYYPSQVAKDYRLSFKELMIDEYQDSNYIQEALVHSISGEDDGRYDRFIVGDIKQSIYRFRNANPELFMEKYDQYKQDEAPLCRYDLSMNYRSRAEVLDATNIVFERIMDRGLGGVDYDDNQRLYMGARYTEDDLHYKTELLLINKDDSGEMRDDELEANLIADRIKLLMDEQLVYDKQLEKMRSCRYGDIVILLRSGGEFSTTLRTVLDKRGIPAFVTSKSGYFQAVEIVTLINYLRILDNPYNDIPMYGSLLSVFGGFDENEVAVLRILGDNKLYEALKLITSAEDDTLAEILKDIDSEMVDNIRKKASTFLSSMSEYRELTRYTPIHRLIRRILNDYDYVNYYGAYPAGEQKKANILMLLNKAEGFEADGFRGLFNFCRYIDRLKKYETDEGEIVTVDENSNVVRIMTMHKSKGLEFPICILAGLHRRLNRKDEQGEIIFHNRYGLGMNYKDSRRHAVYDDVRKKYIASKIHRDSLSEELRIFYVAMTRAKEKLIMTCVSDEGDVSPISGFTGILPDIIRMEAHSYLDVLRMARSEDDWNGQIDLFSYSKNDLETLDLADGLNKCMLEKEIRDAILDTTASIENDEEADEGLRELTERMNFNYPHDNLKDMYVKTSVSELKMAAISDAMIKGSMEDLPVDFFETHSAKEAYIPSFARQEESGRSGTMIGSAYHRVLELIDYAGIGENCSVKTLSESELDGLLDAEIRSGALLAEDYELVNKRKVIRFLESELAHRMIQADKNGKLYKEQPFVLGIDADRLNSVFPKEEMVLIQGIIDVYFVENGEIVLMDYKTDRVSRAEELIQRYSTQLDYYEEALHRITGLNVKERLIYSFALEECISC